MNTQGVSDRNGRRPKSSAFTLIELMIVVAIIGLLAAVAIPAFIKYVRRSKTTEALLNIRKVYDSAIAYYMSEHANPGGMILPKQFPGTAPVPNAHYSGPGGGSCCGQPGSKCIPATAQISAPQAWAALNFSLDEPFLFWYDYVSSGVDLTSKFEIQAHGDLDCDLIASDFIRTGSILADGSVTGGAGLYTNLETE